MADLEPVEQVVRADLSGYVEPIQGEGVEATQELADTVGELNGTLDDLKGKAAETGGALGELAGASDDARTKLAEMGVTVNGPLNSMEALAQAAGKVRDGLTEAGAAAGDAEGPLGTLSGTEDGTTASTEALSREMARFRDIVFETNAEIDDQTASLLAEAAAMHVLGLSAEETANTIGRRGDYQALLDAMGDLERGEAVLVGRNGDLSLGFQTLDGAAVDAEGALNDVGGAADGAGQSIDSAGQDAAAAGGQFALLGPAIGVLVVAALGPVAAIATSVLAIGAAAAFVLPEIREVMKALSGTGTAPKSGPIAEAVSEIRLLEAEWKGVAASSGLQNDFLTEIPQVAKTVGDFLTAVEPLAKAGATSIDEIVNALDRTANSRGFADFVNTIARYAPEATDAVIHLAGAVGNVLGTALTDLAPQAAGDTNALAGLVNELAGPLGAALGTAAASLHGLIESAGNVKTVIGDIIPPLSSAAGTIGVGGLTTAAEHLGKELGYTLGGPVTAGIGMFREIAGSSGHAAAGAKNLGSSSVTMGGDMSAAAAQTQDLASQIANLNAEFTKALTPQLNLDQAAITYSSDLAALKTDLAASGGQIGLNTQAQRTSYQAYHDVIAAAEAYVTAEHNVGGGAGAMRDILRTAISEIDATGVHGQDAAKLVGDLATALHDIPGNVYSTIHLNQVGNVNVGTGGSGGSGAGGGVHIQPGANTVSLHPSSVPAPSLVALGAGGSQQVNVHVDVAGAGLAQFNNPRFLQDLHPVIEEAILRHAYLNQSSGTHFGGFSRVA